MPGRPACMARELTKLFEEVVRAPVEALAAGLAERELKGEVVLVIGPPSRDELAVAVDEDAIRRELNGLMASGMSRKDAVRAVAERESMARNAVYALSLS
jgi:16S rRNA (cytidine1402-2'-O)-methyltransferase